MTTTRPRRADAKVRTGRPVAWFSLLLVISATGGGYLAWEDLMIRNASMMNRFDSLGGSVKQLEGQVQGLPAEAGRIAEQRASQAARQTDEVLKGLRDEVSGLDRVVSGLDNNDWVEDEVEYLLLIANRRLMLEQDVRTAQAALKLADERLRAQREPRLQQVRREIARERLALESLAKVDVTGLALSLSALQGQVESLNIRTARTPLDGPTNTQAAVTGGDSPPSAWQQFFDDLWTSLGSLVTIRRSDRDQVALLPPDERAFLFQNLKLKLEGARLALLQRNDALYQDSLKQAGLWLDRYFDREQAAVITAKKQIEDLKQVTLAPSLPDISGSLRVLRQRNRTSQAADREQGA